MQSTYLQKVLRDYRFEDVKSVFTSMKFRIHLSKTKHLTESRLIHDYQSALEFLMYMMMQT